MDKVIKDDIALQKRCEKILAEWWGKTGGDPNVYLYRAAYADGQRAGMERAATLCEGEALIDDERGYYGVEMGKAIRAKAAVHETI